MNYLINMYVSFVQFWKAPLPRGKQEKLSHIYKFFAFVLLLFFAWAFIPIMMTWLGIAFLSLPPEKGESVGQYEYVEPRKHYNEVPCLKACKDQHQEANEEDNAQTNKENINNYNKNKRDVNSQEGMWRAANALVILTTLQVVIGALTAAYLVRTFNTQRRELLQAKRAADSAESAERAFVDIELEVEYLPRSQHPYIGPKPPEGFWTDRERIQIVPKITNYGKTPARDVTYEISAVYKNRLETIVYRCNQSSTGYFCCSKKPIDILPNNIDSPLKMRILDCDSATATYSTLRACHRQAVGPVDFLVKWSYKTIFSDEIVESAEYIAMLRYTLTDEWDKFDLGADRPKVLGRILSLHFERDKESEYKYGS